MIPLFGNFALWLSLFFVVLQIIYSRKEKNNLVLQINRVAVIGLLACSLLTFASLTVSHLNSDFTLVNVYQNSHSTKPLLYKIAGVWGNHEGSMLLWILVLTIFNYFIFRSYNKNNFKFISNTLESQGIIIIGFLIFTIFTSNPFKLMKSIPVDGLGFNPILQDPALAIHPPLLYVGYVGFSAVFSFGIAALKIKDINTFPWHYYMKPFVVAAWTFLTIGIALGSIWAYYELGWGGWWFWDPVENASLMPWLLGTALLHSLIIVEKRNSLKTWVLLLAILTFLLSVIGTFLVRSGILTSVHTFALDPSRGLYILIFTAILGTYSLILFAIQSKKYLDNNYYAFLSKEGAILANNILMVIVCSTVFLGTVYPLLVETFTNNKISVGEPYYNSTVIPIAIPAILIMGIGPLLSWQKEEKIKILKKIFPNIIITIVATIVIFLNYKTYNIVGIIGIVLAFWIITSNTILILKKVKKNSLSMIVSHFGFGLLILGITGSSIWQEEKILNMNINNQVTIKSHNITFKKIEEIKGPNYVAIRASFLVEDKNRNIITKLEPENRFYPITQIITTEASIHTNLLRDLYIVLGDGNLKDGWVIRIYHNPLVIWIWIGAFIIFLGGIISINKNLKKLNIS